MLGMVGDDELVVEPALADPSTLLGRAVHEYAAQPITARTSNATTSFRAFKRPSDPDRKRR